MPAKQAKDESGAKRSAQATGAEAASDAATLQAYGFTATAGMGTAWVELLSDMGSEVLSFVADRVKEDVKTQHRMLHCKDMSELQQIQADFVHTAIEQYREETGRLVEMSQDFLKAAGSGRTPRT